MSRRWWIPGAALLAGLIGCGGPHEPTAAAESHAAKEEAHVTVRTEPAKLSTIAETVAGLGRCEALPDHLATLTPAVEGHVHELLAKQGDPVKKGQPIVELDKSVALADLAEKTATRDGLKATLQLLKSLPRPEERRANELAIEQAKVAVAQAKAAVERLRPLRARHEISEQQLFDAEQASAQAVIHQQTAEAQLNAMMISPRPEAVAEAEAKIKTADGAVGFSKAHLDFHTIRVPIDGVLDSLTCHPGQTIAIGSPIGEVVDTRQVYATVWLPTRPAQLVRVGQAARVRPAEAQPQSADVSAAEEDGMAGKVEFVGRVADPQTGNLPVRVLVENPKGVLTLGQTVQVTITVEEKKDVLQVPLNALLDLGEGPMLNVVREGKSVTLHPEVGKSHAGWVPVAGTNLKEGEPVIIEGGYNLPEGTPVAMSEDKAVARVEPRQ
jgi:RND family efflux transporter MFP subunit